MEVVQGKEENSRCDNFSFLGEDKQSFNVPVKKSFLFFILSSPWLSCVVLSVFFLQSSGCEQVTFTTHLE